MNLKGPSLISFFSKMQAQYTYHLDNIPNYIYYLGERTYIWTLVLPHHPLSLRKSCFLLAIHRPPKHRKAALSALTLKYLDQGGHPCS